MKNNVALALCLAVAAGFGAALAYGLNRPAKDSATSLPPFEFSRAAAASPEDAALALFQGVATESPKHFAQHILLGVCDGSIDTLQKFAECLQQLSLPIKTKRLTSMNYGRKDAELIVNSRFKLLQYLRLIPRDPK